MAKYTVKLYPKAFQDIEDIYAYIALEKLAPDAAKAQTDRIWHALLELESLPQSHQDRLVGRFAKQGYKQLIIDNYIAIYKIDEKNKTVFVVTVQYHGRNL